MKTLRRLPLLVVAFLLGDFPVTGGEILPALPPAPAGGDPVLVSDLPYSPRITGAPDVVAKTMPWEAHPGQRLLRMESRRAWPNPWNAAVHFPFGKGIEAGHSGLLWFYTRKVAGAGEIRTGASVLVGGQSDGAYRKAMSHDFRPGEVWSLVLVPFQALEGVLAGTGEVSFHLGEQAQSIEIAGLNLLDYGRSIEVGDLPQPALSYPGREPDAPWRQQALARIESLRKGNFTLRVEDGHGHPVPGASVRVNLRRHRFGFGSAVTASWLNRPGPDGAMYREIVDRYFSRVVLESDLKEMGWKRGAAEPPDKQFSREQTFRALDWLEDRGIETRGHCLSWGVFDEFTAPLKSNPEALKSHMLDHISEILPAIGGRVVEWDAINHPASWSPTNRITNVTGRGFYAEIMQHARGLSRVPMWLNEDQVFRPGRQQEEYFAEAKALVEAGQAPDGIGIQGHFHCSFLPSPEEMLRISDRFASIVPRLQITEFDILANGDEKLQADWFRDCLIMAFSHPAYTGFQTWGFTERTVVRKEAMPWKADWSELPLAGVWKTWVGKYWHTALAGTTDDRGECVFRGYHGRYTVAVEAPSGRRVVDLFLHAGQRQGIIVLP